MGCCFAKSSALTKEGESAVETVPRVPFPVVVDNPVSTGAESSPSTCSTVSTSSGEASEEECPCEDESKAREVLRRMAVRWTTVKAGQGGDGPTVDRKATPRPALRARISSSNDGSDSDPWDVVPGGDL
jgi:hypothetical protein